MEEPVFDFRAIFADMRATLDKYEKVIADFKVQIQEYSLLKIKPPLLQKVEEKIQNVRSTRDSFDQECKKEAIEMCFYLMETTHASRHKAAGQVAALMEIKPRTVYAWMKKLRKRM